MADLPIGKQDNDPFSMSYETLTMCLLEANQAAIKNQCSTYIGMDVGRKPRQWVWFFEEYLSEIPAVLEVKPDNTVYPYHEREK